jgi:ribosomal-protein-alanine N-acetyltransferase
VTLSAITIRSARPGEGQALGELGFAAWGASAFSVHDDGRADRHKLLEDFVSFATKKWATILVADVDGAPAGWGAREDGDQRISDLWVSPARQGQGIGAALLAALEAEIRTAGHAIAELETLAANHRAIAFYERHNFRVVWHAERLSPTLGYVIDKVGLNKSLTV